MTDEGLPGDRLNRILTAVETIDESLGVLARKQQVGREDYKADSDTRDIVERRFVKMTEAAIDIAEELVKHERGQPPASNPASMRALGEIGVLSGSLAEEMAQGARFRNVLSTPTGTLSIMMSCTMRWGPRALSSLRAGRPGLPRVHWRV